jgi:F0F1-type ATP synthase membrane subunit c/vacuolar-type H+-ATPase subunit K
MDYGNRESVFAACEKMGEPDVQAAVDAGSFGSGDRFLREWLNHKKIQRTQKEQAEANERADKDRALKREELQLKDRELVLRKEEMDIRERELMHAEWQTRYVAKSEFTNLGFKGLILINAGAAAALAALFQALVSKPDAVRMLPFVLWAIGWCVTGTAIAAGAFFFRYLQSMLEDRSSRFLWYNPFWMLFWVCGIVALACFVGALLYVVHGGLTTFDFNGPTWHRR